MARTAREVIKGSLRLLGVIGRGVALSNEDAADMLELLNDMLTAFSIEKLMIPAVTQEDFTLSTGSFTYSIGSGQTFNATTPIEIEAAKIIDANSNEYDLQIATLEEWNKIKDSATQGRPYILRYDRPTSVGSIRLHFIPNAAETLRLFSTRPLTSFTNLSMDHVFPDEYSLMLKYNLAVFGAPEHGKTPRADVVALAIETKKNIKIQNYEPELIEIDGGLLNRESGFNIEVG